LCDWDKLREATKDHHDKLECKKLFAVLSLSNMTVGDAIANVFVIEAILRDKDFSINDFFDLYIENPSKMYKAVVSDRTKFKTVWNETELTQPKELQEEINKAIASVTNGKAFVRPSGTEDILRLYSEAATVEEVDKLAQ